MKKSLRFSAVVLTLVMIISCGKQKGIQTATQFIPEDCPVVCVTNPHHIISQSQISEQKDILRSLEIPSDFFDNLSEYGIDENENVFAFLVSKSTYGASMKLADSEKFINKLCQEERFCKIFDKKNSCLYDDESGFKIIDDVIVFVYGENEDKDGIRRVIRDIEQSKGPNKTNQDRFFQEMIDEPSVLSVWMEPQKVIKLLRGTRFSHFTSKIRVLSSYLAEEGSVYYSIKSENGKLSLASAGNYLDREYLDEFEKYSSKHLDYIPQDADMVLGFSLNGNIIIDFMEALGLKSHIDMAKMLGLDIWSLIDNINGDITLSINSLKMNSGSVVPEVDASILINMEDEALASSFASNLNNKFSPLSKKVEDNTYEIFLESLGQLNYGLKNRSLYLNLSKSSFNKVKKAYKFNRLKNNVIAVMSIKSDNIDKETFRLLEKKVGMDLDFFDSMDMVTWLEADVVRQEFELNLHNDINPLALILTIIKKEL